MPIQPNDHYQQDPERLWQAAEAVGGIRPSRATGTRGRSARRPVVGRAEQAARRLLQSAPPEHPLTHHEWVAPKGSL